MYFSFSKLDEKLSETVLDQFVQHIRNLKILSIEGKDLLETDRIQVLQFASRIIEEQEESEKQEELFMYELILK